MKLSEGCIIECKYCGQEHTATATHTSIVEVVRRMLYVFCTKPKPGMYYVGRIGGQSNRGKIIREGN